jgi:hypothetical protein
MLDYNNAYSRADAIRERVYNGTMAKKKSVESATKRPKKSRPASVELETRQIEVVEKPTRPNQFTPLQILVVQGLARGFTIPDMARKFGDLLCPHVENRDKRLKMSRTKIRHWMAGQKFRDLLWEESVIGLDLDSPRIVRGISRKAQAGRIDAARLALELNGRHAPQTEVTPARINIQFGDIPRPRRSLDDPNVVDVDPDEIVEIEDD